MNKKNPTTITPLAKEIGHYPIAELSEKRAKLIQSGVKVYDFGAGDDSLPIAPIILEALRENLPNTSRYPLVRGSLELRGAIKNYINRRFKVTTDLNQILPVTGSKEGIYHLPSLVIDPQSERNKVLGPALAYPPYIKGTQVAFGEYVPIQGGADQNYLIDLSNVSQELLSTTALVYLNFPHNPTGASCTLEYLKQQVTIAKDYGILLVSDECYADIYFDSPPPSILEITTKGVLAFHSLSKRSGMTGFRSGFVAGDSAFIDGYARLRNAIGTALPAPIDIASIAAWSDDEHVKERREAFSKIRKRFLTFLDEINLEYLKTDASFYVWVKAPDGKNGKEYAILLQEKGIFVAPADYFGPGSPEWFRISLVLSLEECEEVFEIWRSL